MPSEARKVDCPAWLEPVKKRIGVGKWMRRRTYFDKEFYYDSLDARRKLWVEKQGHEPSDSHLAVIVSAMTKDIGDLKRHVSRESVPVADEKDWATILEAAGWAVVEKYFKDIEKEKWKNVVTS